MILSEELIKVQKQVLKEALKTIKRIENIPFDDDKSEIFDYSDGLFGYANYFDNNGVRIYKIQTEPNRHIDIDEEYWIVDEKDLKDKKTAINRMFGEDNFSHPHYFMGDILNKGRIMSIRKSNKASFKLDKDMASHIKPPYYSITYGYVPNPIEKSMEVESEYIYSMVIDSIGTYIHSGGTAKSETMRSFETNGGFSAIANLEMLEYLGVDKGLLSEYKSLLERDGNKPIFYGDEFRTRKAQKTFHNKIDNYLNNNLEFSTGESNREKVKNLKPEDRDILRQEIVQAKKDNEGALKGLREAYKNALSGKTVRDITNISFIEQVKKMIKSAFRDGRNS